MNRRVNLSSLKVKGLWSEAEAKASLNRAASRKVRGWRD
jgi:hypothetical protein